METYTQELSGLQDYLHGLERRLSRTRFYTGQETPSWGQLSEGEQQRVGQLGSDISAVCHHLTTYSAGLPGSPDQDTSGE